MNDKTGQNHNGPFCHTVKQDQALDELLVMTESFSNDDRDATVLRDELQQDFTRFVSAHGWERMNDPRFRKVVKFLEYLIQRGARLERDRAVRSIAENMAWLSEKDKIGDFDDILQHYHEQKEFYDQTLPALRCSYVERIFPNEAWTNIHVQEPAEEYARITSIFKKVGIVL